MVPAHEDEEEHVLSSDHHIIVGTDTETGISAEGDRAASHAIPCRSVQSSPSSVDPRHQERTRLKSFLSTLVDKEVLTKDLEQWSMQRGKVVLGRNQGNWYLRCLRGRYLAQTLILYHSVLHPSSVEVQPGGLFDAKKLDAVGPFSFPSLLCFVPHPCTHCQDLCGRCIPGGACALSNAAGI